VNKPLQRFGLVLALIVGLGAAAAWWFWPRPALNLLLITLDTTRADRIGCYGYPAGETPVLDELARSGVQCTYAITVAPCTLPAHASLFTGLYPAENGVRTNGRARLDAALPTLAAALEKQGYQTGAFIGSYVLNHKFGLDSGFQTYDDDFAGDGPADEALHRQRQGSSVVDAALKWLRKDHSGPTFCWVHLYDPHQPYLPHEDLFGDKYVDRPYDAEIAYVDRQVGRLVEFLKAQGQESNTLVVVVGDHGEGFGEHSEYGHSMTLYQEALHVPLIFRCPSQLPVPRKMTDCVSLVDVSPTILDLLRVTDPRTTTGRSLAAALRGSALADPMAYGATDDPFLSNGWSPLRSLTAGGWKYIRTTRPELYNLSADPGELRNLFDSHSDESERMMAKMAALEAKLVPRSEVEVQLSPAERRTLASLGYAAGAATTVPLTGENPAEAVVLPDVKDMLPLDVAADEASKLLDEGNDEGIEKLRAIIRQAPGLTKAYWNLAFGLRKRSQVDQAIEVFQDLLKARPDCREGHNGLGIIALDDGRTEEAISEFKKVIDVDPDFADVHYNLALAYLRLDKRHEALSHLNSLLEIDTFNAQGYDLRGDVLSQLGRKNEAIADYQRALKYAAPKE